MDNRRSTLPSVVVRTRFLSRALALAGALLMVLAVPAGAQKSVAEKVLADFGADGVIDPCKHTSEELRLVKENIPPDFEQYAPDYPAAVAAALEARARGECAGKKPQAAVVPAATATPAPTPEPTPVATRVPLKTVVPEPPEPEKIAVVAGTTAPKPSAKPDLALERVATARPANDAPAAVILLAVLAGLLGVSALFLMTMKRFGWEEGRLAPVAHAWREANWRTAGLWQDFRDWLRLGR
jgi:hypothetical protein